MNRREFVLGLAAASLLATPIWAADLAPGLSEETFKKLDAKVENLVKAYNGNDWKKFFNDYAKAMSGLANEATFTALYTNNYKRTFGNVKSRKLNGARSTMADQNGLTVYDVTCDKKGGILAVNWMKEGSDWKVQQVQFQ